MPVLTAMPNRSALTFLTLRVLAVAGQDNWDRPVLLIVPVPTSAGADD